MEIFLFICYNFNMINLENTFLQRMHNILGNEYGEFLSSLDKNEQKGIFINNHKINTKKFEEIVDFPISPVPYEKSGFYIDNIKLGRHPLHHAGAFYVQDPSAMFTVNALNFKGDEMVLDMCASPGGKSIQIANRIPNGILISNEIVKSRAQILYSNVERMGLDNVLITNEEPKNIALAYAGEIDVCLVDAPCSGEGMFRRGEEITKSWNANLPKMCSIRQLEILEEANKCLKENGYLIYSTCTYSIEENEDVVRAFMAKHDYELINIEYPFSRGVGLNETVRLYPHKVKGEGQFVALMKKLEKNNLCSNDRLNLKENKNIENFLKKITNFNKKVYNYKNFSFIIKDLNIVKKDINYLSIGVLIGVDKKNYIDINHYLFSAFGAEFKNHIEFEYNDPNVLKYLRGETIDVSGDEGFGAIIVSGCPLGGYKISNGKFKNLYPKGLRNFN